MAPLLFLIFVNLKLCLSRIYNKIEKDESLTFKLENISSEYYASLNYSDDYEEFEKEEDKINDRHNFLKIDQILSANCIILNKNNSIPNETVLNRFNKTDYCQLNITLNFNKKLIDFPRNISKEEIIYFIFFIENSTENFEKNKIYEIKRIKTPKPITDKLSFEIDVKETFVYLFDRNIYNNGIYAPRQFNIPLYEFDIIDGMVEFGFVGEDNPIFTYPFSSNDENNKYLYVVIDNDKKEKQSVELELIPREIDWVDFLNLTYEEEFFISYHTRLLNLIEIFNPDGKIIEFDFLFNKIAIFDYNIKDIEDLYELTNFSYYKYISPGYYYSSKKYFIILIIYDQYYYRMKDIYLNFLDIEKTSDEITEKYNIFKIKRNSEISLKIKHPNENVVLKILSDTKGIIEINNIKYNIINENQIEEIDIKNINSLIIKALDNDFVFAMKSKINEKLIAYASMEEDYNISFSDKDEIFVVYNIDYTNFSYISFYLKFEESLNSNFEYGINFGFLEDYEIEKNPKNYKYKSSENIFDLKYYKNKNNVYNKKLLLTFYFGFLDKNANITIKTKNYKPLIYKDNAYAKNWGNHLINIFYEQKQFYLYFYSMNGSYMDEGKNEITYRSNPFIYKYDPSFFRLAYPFIFSFYGYVMKIPYEGINYNISVESMYDSIKEINIINSTHFSINFDFYFTGALEKNFYLFLSDKKDDKNCLSIIYSLENFYLKNQSNNPEYEFYSFYHKDSYNNYKEYDSVIFPMSKKFDLNEEDREIIFYLIGEALPYKIVYVYTPIKFKTKNSNNENNSDNSDNTDNIDINNKNNNLKKILIITIPSCVGFIIIIIIILSIILCNKKKKNLENEINTDDSLKQGFNISMSKVDN